MDIFSFLETNKVFIYFFLSFWVVVASIFPLNLLIYSEIFILSGAILSWLEVIDFFTIFITLLFSWFIWDSISFFIWYKYWDKLFEKIALWKSIISRANLSRYEKITGSFERNISFSIFVWRLWFFLHYFTPFIAWKLKVRYIRFLKYSSLWLLLSIWFLLFIWFFIWENLVQSLFFVKEYIFLILFLFIVTVSVYFYFRRYIIIAYNKYERIFDVKKTILLRLLFKHLLYIFYVVVTIYVIALYLIFFQFWSNKTPTTNNFDYNLTNIEEINNYTNFKTYYDNNIYDIIQPVNIVLITDKDIRLVLDKLWWIENKTFVWNNINFKEFYSLYKSKELPVSNLYLDWKVQNTAFQMKSNSNFKRTHLRVWNFWTLNNEKVYLISVSKDTKIDIEFYNKFLTPIHEIDLNVDEQRDLLLEQSEKVFNNIVYSRIKINTIDDSLFYKYNYYTDWFIYIIQV